MSKLLIQDRPLILLPGLAKELGSLSQAVVLQQIHFMSTLPNSGKDYGGHHWVWGSYETLCQEWFTMWNGHTLRKHINALEKKGYLVSEQLRKKEHDRTKYYRIDYEKLGIQSIASNRPETVASNRPETVASYNELTESTTEKKGAKNQNPSSSSLSTSTTKPNLLLEYRDASGETGIVSKAFRAWFSNITSQYADDDCLVAFQKLRNDIQTSRLKGMSKWERTQHHLRNPNANATRDKVNVSQAADELKSLYSEAF